MSQSPNGPSIQGAQDYGEVAAEYPVLITVQDANGNVGTLKLTAAGALPVDASGSPASTVNQGSPNAGGASAWPVQGSNAVGAALAGNPFAVAVIDLSTGNVRSVSGVSFGGGPFGAALYPVLGDGTAIKAASQSLDGSTGAGIQEGLGYGQTGTSGGIATFSPLRSASVFKSVTATAAGSTAVWTPAAGKKFRLMRYCIELTQNVSLAAGAVLTASLLDAAADIAQDHSFFVPTTAVTTTAGVITTGWIDLGNGVRSAAANNVLNVNLSAALATGTCRVVCCGIEE